MKNYIGVCEKFMLGCNQNITVWIRKKEANKAKETREVFVRYVLPVKCRWKNFTERSVSGGTSNVYNSVAIIIPYFESTEDFDFDILEIKTGDIAALGVYDDIDITGVSPYTLSEVKRLLGQNIVTINSVACNFDLERGESPVTAVTPPFAKGGLGEIDGGTKINKMKGGHLRLTGN